MANEFKVKKGLIIEGSSGTVLDVQGSVGQLFSVTNSLTGDLFAVSDISGVPILNVNSSGAVDIDGTLGVSGNIVTTGASSTFNTGGSGTFVTNDSNSTPRITVSSSNAQLGLFRSSTGIGGMYIGGSSSGFRIYTEAFVQKLLVDQSGSITAAGNITVAGNQYFNGEFIEGDGKEMFRYSDAWLRINEDNDFSSGIYCGTGVLRTDGAFQIGSAGAKALITAAGAATFLGSVSASNLSGTNTGDQTNISGNAATATAAGYVTNQGGQLLSHDNRTIKPNEINSEYLQFGFTSFNNNNTGPWADYLHLRSYGDSSGGNDNLLVISRSTKSMRLYQQSWNSSTAYSSYVDFWTTGDFTSTNVSNWNTAYGWGNHASAGYSTATGVANNANNYSLPAGTASTRGGFKIGYSENAKNYPVEVSSEKMYVNVPWTDNNTDTITSVGVSGSETTGTITLTAAGATTLTQSGGTVEIRSTDTNTTYSVGDNGLTQKNFTSTLKNKLDGIEANATADQTATQILTAIKTVDGAGSGLDADTLDTYSSASFARKAEANPIFINGLSKQNARYQQSVTSKYPLGHYTPGDTVFEIDPTWDDSELKGYFNSNNVTWATEANAPGGYSIYINGSTGAGGVYGSGFPMIPIDQDGIYYQECWIKNATSSTMGHYMGSNDYEADFTAPASGAGNPGSYGYWVMSNQNPGNTWTKVSGYITGHHNSNTGAFETDATYFTPLALFNYTTPAAGTRACWISGWKIIRVDQVGDRTFQDDVKVKGKLEVHTLDTNTSSTAALVMNVNEVEKRTLGSNAFNSTAFSTATGVEDNADVTDTTNVVAALTAGTNVTIASNGTISSVDTTYSTSDFDAAGSADAVQSNLDTVAANIAGISNQSNTDVDTGTETIATVATGTYTAAFFDFVIKNGTNVRAGTVYSCHDGTNVEFTETSTVDLGDTSDVTLSVDKSGTSMRLRATTTSNNWSVKSLVRAI